MKTFNFRIGISANADAAFGLTVRVRGEDEEQAGRLAADVAETVFFGATSDSPFDRRRVADEINPAWFTSWTTAADTHETTIDAVPGNCLPHVEIAANGVARPAAWLDEPLEYVFRGEGEVSRGDLDQVLVLAREAAEARTPRETLNALVRLAAVVEQVCYLFSLAEIDPGADT